MDGDSAGNAEDDGFVFLFHGAYLFVLMMWQIEDTYVEEIDYLRKSYPHHWKMLIESKRL